VSVIGSVGATSVLPNFGLTLTRTFEARFSVLAVATLVAPDSPGAVTLGPTTEVTVTTTSSELAHAETASATETTMANKAPILR
jgi:hypothetical protein